MGRPVAGDIVVVPFPHTNLEPGKRRPALVVAVLPGDDLILCQITSQPPRIGAAVPLLVSEIIQGRLTVNSYIRPQRLFTVDRAVIHYVAGGISPEKLGEVRSELRKLFP